MGTWYQWEATPLSFPLLSPVTRGLESVWDWELRRSNEWHVCCLLQDPVVQRKQSANYHRGSDTASLSQQTIQRKIVEFLMHSNWIHPKCAVSGGKNALVFWHKGSVSLFENESSRKLLEENCIEVTLLCPPTLFRGLTMAQLSQQLNQSRTKNPSGRAVMQNEIHCKIVHSEDLDKIPSDCKIQ